MILLIVILLNKMIRYAVKLNLVICHSKMIEQITSKSLISF